MSEILIIDASCLRQALDAKHEDGAGREETCRLEPSELNSEGVGP